MIKPETRGPRDYQTFYSSIRLMIQNFKFHIERTEPETLKPYC